MNQAIELCDYTVRIPMSHEVDSLNVAASCGYFLEIGERLSAKFRNLTCHKCNIPCPLLRVKSKFYIVLLQAQVINQSDEYGD